MSRIKRICEKCLFCIEKSVCYSLVIFITPCFFIFEILVVRPIVVKNYGLSDIEHTFHIICPTFCFINVVGNMILGIFTNTNLTQSATTPEDSYCDLCKMSRPAKAWHCKMCNTCILRRDHHCFFFSRCIGLHNQRYYIIYLGYIFISMVYSAYYNYFYVRTIFDYEDLYITAFRIVIPFLRYLLPERMGVEDLYVFFLFLNASLVLWSGAMFWFHLRNVLRGVTARDYKGSRSVDWSTMRRNVINVLGVRWYWAILWPFAYSPLPEFEDKLK